MKASIITVCFNSSKTIFDCIDSVNNQTYASLEHIFIDANSEDETPNIIKKYSKRDLRFVSESDNGIYDAMNKGVKIATGDFICFLNSDDFYSSNNVIENVSKLFIKNNLDVVYGNIDYVNSQKKYIRTFKSPSNFRNILNGFQIPHPAIFIKSSYLKNMNYPFDPNLKIASDFGQQIYLANNFTIRAEKINKSLVKMRIGGASGNFMNRMIGWIETSRIFNRITKRNGVYFVFWKIINNIISKF